MAENSAEQEEMKNRMITIVLSGVLVVFLIAAGGIAAQPRDAIIIFSSNVKGELEACG